MGQPSDAELTDGQLWALLQQNECAALSEIFERHGQVIFRYCARRLGDRNLAEDMLSIVFLETWDRRTERINYGTLRSFLYGIAIDVVAHQRRYTRRHRRALRSFSGSAGCEVPPTDMSAAISNELLMECLDTFLALPRALQDVVSLSVWEQLTPVEVAAAVGTDVKTVQGRLERGKRRLAEGEVVFRRSGRVL